MVASPFILDVHNVDVQAGPTIPSPAIELDLEPLALAGFVLTLHLHLLHLEGLVSLVVQHNCVDQLDWFGDNCEDAT